MVGMTLIYLPGVVLERHAAESLKRDGPQKAVSRCGLACVPSGFPWRLTAAAKPHHEKGARVASA
jgi:hypothetical protein